MKLEPTPVELPLTSENWKTFCEILVEQDEGYLTICCKENLITDDEDDIWAEYNPSKGIITFADLAYWKDYVEPDEELSALF